MPVRVILILIRTSDIFQAVSHSSVRLMVIANLMISPSEAYVLKYATVRYKVEQIRQNSVVGKLSCVY